MKTNRRKFISSAVVGGLAATTLPLSSCGSKPASSDSQMDLISRYARLDQILRLPVLKKELFPSPVIIETIEFLRDRSNFLCRVRSKDGAEGISVGHRYISLRSWPVMGELIRRFTGRDARDLDALTPEIHGKTGGIPYNVQLATLEFAILDMLGNTANKSVGQLIGEIHNPRISIYQGTRFMEQRQLPPEESLELIKQDLLISKAKAVKIRAGLSPGGVLDGDLSPGQSEKLIRMARETFGDEMVLMCDGNNHFSAEGAIRMGRILEENNYYWWEEPVPFLWNDELKMVRDGLNIPIASGESDSFIGTFRWLIANNAVDIYMPDTIYFGGMIRSMRVARMAAEFGKEVSPHITNNGLGYIYMLQLVSAIPNANKYHEFQLFTTYDGNGNEIPIESKTMPITSEDGVITVPMGSGLGINIDPDYVKTHKLVHW